MPGSFPGAFLRASGEAQQRACECESARTMNRRWKRLCAECESSQVLPDTPVAVAITVGKIAVRAFATTIRIPPRRSLLLLLPLLLELPLPRAAAAFERAGIRAAAATRRLQAPEPVEKPVEKPIEKPTDACLSA